MRIYWTIQRLAAWEKSKAVGYLVGDPEFIWTEFLEAYKWIMKQMEVRLSHYHGEFPLWLWTERPDLRKSGHLSKGENGVLLKVELDDSNVLISDFQAWHCVLSNTHCALNEEEDEQLQRDKEIENIHYDGLKEDSWERIFDINLLMESEYWTGARQNQGVTGRISLNQVIGVRLFCAK
jgi:hypothetical protein